MTSFIKKSEAAEYKYTNRLAREKSPYLLQHAHNPVDWYAWGEEAFEKARKENKPVFLSVGYSTCHWCHMMAHESFENEDIANMMNENFVSIKVDREERPDVDRVYMTYVQATTGSGGWPMSVWLTPDLKPFFGGTYYPPEDRWEMSGFKAVLSRIAEAWKSNNKSIADASDAAVRQLLQLTSIPVDKSVKPEESLLDAGYSQIKSSYEPIYGGFSGAPKFPRPVTLNFMLRYYAYSGKQDALAMVLFTLHKMAEGGMHDHIGGGFHRYSVDNYWHVPHFEKMLYDQAQLVCSYLEAYQITHEKFCADIARDILEYVLRDMTGSDGQFYSAEDADSPMPENPVKHAEGAFYVWEWKEIVQALGKEQAEIFSYHYGIEKDGNVPADPHGEFYRKNILIVSRSFEDTGREFGKTSDEIRKQLELSKQKLFLVRVLRPRPHLDDKTITAWNGLMISAFARGAQILNEPCYLDAALKALHFAESRLYNANSGTLRRRYRDGESAVDGFADDYAFFIQGLIDLYEASFDIKHLTMAVELQHKQNELFLDKENGGCFNTSGCDPNIILKMKEEYDVAEPSANSITALNLLRLSQMTGDKDFRELAEQTFRCFSAQLQHAPSAMPQMLSALDFHLDNPMQIIIAGRPDAADTRAILREIHFRYMPNKIILLADGEEGQQRLAKQLEFIKDMTMIDGKATAFICENYVCKLPSNDLSKIIEILDAESGNH